MTRPSSRFAEQFDGALVDENAIAATPEDFDRAHGELEADVREAITFAAANIRKFHELQKPEASWSAEIRPGLHAGDRTTPIASVACYIPRGKGSFPSHSLDDLHSGQRRRRRRHLHRNAARPRWPHRCGLTRGRPRRRCEQGL